MVPDRLDAPGAEVSRQAKLFLKNEWDGQSLMAIGPLDPVFTPKTMDDLQCQIRHCPDPIVVEGAGHFVQEHGESVARAALDYFAAG
jgi:tRNA(adenine34) deaminase